MRHVTPQTEAMKNRAAILVILNFSKHHKTPFQPCKTRKTPEYTLVLDLDETLVHCSLCPLQMRDHEFSFPISFQNVDYDVYVKTRPYLRDFLERMCENFEIIIFTASKKVRENKLKWLQGHVQSISNCTSQFPFKLFWIQIKVFSIKFKNIKKKFTILNFLQFLGLCG